jgi:hypothetical protein
MGRSRASSDRRGAAGFPGHSVTATLKLFQERGETSPEEAGKQGTFAVGGLLVDESGAEATNAVIRNGNLSDPTATRRPSGRRLACARTAPQALPFTSQLNNRQFARSMRECAGAILRSGMRVIIVAEDNFAGVHENLKPMPRELQVFAQPARARRHAPGPARSHRAAAEGCDDCWQHLRLAGGRAISQRRTSNRSAPVVHCTSEIA